MINLVAHETKTLDLSPVELVLPHAQNGPVVCVDFLGGDRIRIAYRQFDKYNCTKLALAIDAQAVKSAYFDRKYYDGKVARIWHPTEQDIEYGDNLTITEHVFVGDKLPDGIMGRYESLIDSALTGQKPCDFPDVHINTLWYAMAFNHYFDGPIISVKRYSDEPYVVQRYYGLANRKEGC